MLNMACNTKDPEMMEYLINCNMIPNLVRTLVDERFSWMTNGASIALLQLSIES